MWSNLMQQNGPENKSPSLVQEDGKPAAISNDSLDLRSSRLAEVVEAIDSDQETDQPKSKIQNIKVTKSSELDNNLGVPTPREIYLQLKMHVVGNDLTLRRLAIAGHQHLKRIGMQLPVALVQEAIEREIKVLEPQSDGYKEFVREMTLLMRRHEINRKKDNPLPELVQELLRAGREAGVIGVAKSTKGGGLAGHKRVIKTLQELKREQEGIPSGDLIKKANILLIGETGTGKTYMIRTLAKVLGVPFAYIDSSAISQVGYQGDDAKEVIINGLLAAAAGEPTLANQGIVLLDEIDKNAANRSEGQDVSGKGAQQNLLAHVESHFDQESEIDTSDVLFIAAGAFTGLSKIVARRLGRDARIGFNIHAADGASAGDNLLQRATEKDLRQFGMIPELIGRFPTTLVTDPMTPDMLKRVLREPKNSIIRQHQRLLEIDGVQMDFSEEALDELAAAAARTGLGARSLESIVQRVLEDLHFEAPELHMKQQVILEKEFVASSLAGL